MCEISVYGSLEPWWFEFLTKLLHKRLISPVNPSIQPRKDRKIPYHYIILISLETLPRNISNPPQAPKRLQTPTR